MVEILPVKKNKYYRPKTLKYYFSYIISEIPRTIAKCHKFIVV